MFVIIIVLKIIYLHIFTVYIMTHAAMGICSTSTLTLFNNLFWPSYVFSSISSSGSCVEFMVCGIQSWNAKCDNIDIRWA